MPRVKRRKISDDVGRHNVTASPWGNAIGMQRPLYKSTSSSKDVSPPHPHQPQTVRASDSLLLVSQPAHRRFQFLFTSHTSQRRASTVARSRLAGSRDSRMTKSRRPPRRNSDSKTITAHPGLPLPFSAQDYPGLPPLLFDEQQCIGVMKNLARDLGHKLEFRTEEVGSDSGWHSVCRLRTIDGGEDLKATGRSHNKVRKRAWPKPRCPRVFTNMLT